MTKGAERTIDLSVIIVNYNTRDLLERCLSSLRGASSGLDSQVVVVDNDSQDGSAAMVEDKFPEAHLIRAGANLGYARANHRGAAMAAGKYLLFLNPDTAVRADTLRAMSAYALARTRVGAVGCRVRLADGSIQDDTCGRFFTFGEWLLTRAGFRLLIPGHTIFAGRAFVDSGLVDWVSGVCMLVPAEAFRETGGFCEAMFAYMEDMDLCRRLHQRGLSCHYMVETEIMHVRGAAFSRQAPSSKLAAPDLQQRSYLESELTYVRRNWSLAARAAFQGFVTVRELLKLLTATLAGNRHVAARSRWLLGRLFSRLRREG